MTPSIEIYQTVPYGQKPDQDAETFARWRTTGRVTNVGVHTSGAPLLTAAGEYVAYPQPTYGKYPDDASYWNIIKVNVATGARISVPASGNFFAEVTTPQQ